MNLFRLCLLVYLWTVGANERRRARVLPAV